MTSIWLPRWLPDWDGAEVVARSIDIGKLKDAVRNLVDSILVEDTVTLDSLDPDLETALISPLNTLAKVYEGSDSLVELVVAARLVRRSAMPYLGNAPDEIRLLIESLPG